jgi:hypothetical protein
MSKQWYTIEVTPIDQYRAPYNFRIETLNLENMMNKYTRDKEGNVTALWKILK